MGEAIFFPVEAPNISRSIHSRTAALVAQKVEKRRNMTMKFKKYWLRVLSGIRRYWFALLGAEIGPNVELESHIKIYRSRRRVSIGKNSVVRSWSVLNAWSGEIRIGEHCSVNSFVHISGNGGVYIGNNVLIATQCVLVSANHIYEDPDRLICEQGESRKAIRIGNDCWLGAGAKVLAGVEIGEGCVIGAGAVVTQDIPPYSVAVGVPARVIKSRR